MLLEISNLSIAFKENKVIDGLDLTINHNEMVALVGESGSGKTLTALAIMGLLPKGANLLSGSINFKGQNILKLPKKEMQALRGRDISLVFQEPMTALNPVLSIGNQVAEIFSLRAGLSKQRSKEKTLELLKKVGLPDPEKKFADYPHRFSGGMRQRVVLAMAMALNPALLIADEPTTALDPTIQAQIVDLMSSMLEKEKTSTLLITHNLALVGELTTKTTVMYLGVIMEDAKTSELFKNPAHPYTAALIKALPPALGAEIPRRLPAIEGHPPSILNRPLGCPFSPRCLQAFEICYQELPVMKTIKSKHFVRCHLY